MSKLMELRKTQKFRIVQYFLSYAQIDILNNVSLSAKLSMPDAHYEVRYRFLPR